MPIATSRGTRIHYTEVGDRRLGPAVVLLQGLGLSSRFWFDVPELLAHDPKTPRFVLAIDNRGTGKSDKPRRFWSMGAMADDVVAVLDHAGVDAAFIVGISMGGMIAQHVALRHSARVRGLVLLATTPGFLGGALPEPVALGRLLSVPFGGARAADNLTRLLLPESKWGRAREIFRDWPRAMRDDPTAPHTFAAHLVAASTHLVKGRLRQITCPVVVVAGALDALVPLRNSQVLAREIPGAELEIVPETGHAVFADDRDLVRRMVVRLEQAIERGLAAAAPPPG
jgi:pimeloyl-ACP methyl ester carboxylesterase